MQGRAAALDEAGAFPAADIADLRRCGALASPNPVALGGCGLGTEASGAAAALTLLRLLGQGNLPIGRVFEAHVNALRLLFRYGDEAVRRHAARDAADGHLLGLWVTDPAGGGLSVGAGGVLHGTKQFCSGAGHVSRAVVTATDSAGAVRLAYTQNGAGFSAAPLPGSLSGMRAASTGQVRYEGADATLFGQPWRLPARARFLLRRLAHLRRHRRGGGSADRAALRPTDRPPPR